MSCFKGRDKSEKVGDSSEYEVSQNDAFIVFLDAASDGNADELIKAYEKG